jgi:hypothetical protein
MPEWMGHVSIVSCASRDALNEEYESAIPVRVLPGHGRWVPVGLVEAIEDAWNNGTVKSVSAAIRAALEGEV